MADQDPSLQLTDVIEQFSSSKSVLEDVAGKLRNLALIEQAQQDDQAALREAATVIQQAAQSLETLVTTGTEAIESARSLTATAAEVLAASDAKKLHDRIDKMATEFDRRLEQYLARNTEQLSDLQQRLAAVEGELGGQLGAIADQLTRLEDSRRRERELQAKLDKVRSDLRPSKLRKLGLSD